MRAADIDGARNAAVAGAGGGGVLPEADGDDDLFGVVARVNREGEDAGGTDDVAGGAGRQSADLSDELAVAEELIALFDGGELEDERRGVRRHPEMEAEPAELGAGGVALGCPVFGWLEGGPR